MHLCEHKTIYLGREELIVGERGPRPKAVPTYPELTCHSERGPAHSQLAAQDQLRRLRRVPAGLRARRSSPTGAAAACATRSSPPSPAEWKDAYDAGIFTEFMEQRAPGHTVLDGKIYRRGLLDFQERDRPGDRRARFPRRSARPTPSASSFAAMRISCDAVMLFAQRHAELARQQAAAEPRPGRQAELEKIAAVCRHVPAHAPRDFHEALQSYWFCHLAVITELNGWDSLQPRPPRPAPACRSTSAGWPTAR